VAFFLVTTLVNSPKGHNVAFAFETAANDLDELHEAFAENGTVKGIRYRIVNSREGNDRRLTEPRPTLLGICGFALIAPFAGIEHYKIEPYQK